MEEFAEDLKIQESLRSIVRESVSKKQEKAKGKAQQIGTVFKPGDRVWRQNIRSQQRKGGKLDAGFLGPYTVINVQGKNSDIQDDNGVIFRKINTDHLKICIRESPRLPHCLKNQESKKKKKKC